MAPLSTCPAVVVLHASSPYLENVTVQTWGGDWEQEHWTKIKPKSVIIFLAVMIPKFRVVSFSQEQ